MHASGAQRSDGKGNGVQRGGEGVLTTGGGLHESIPQSHNARVVEAAHDAQLPESAPCLVWAAENAWDPLECNLQEHAR